MIGNTRVDQATSEQLSKRPTLKEHSDPRMNIRMIGNETVDQAPTHLVRSEQLY